MSSKKIYCRNASDCKVKKKRRRRRNKEGEEKLSV
jgi:hypothetical protein